MCSYRPYARVFTLILGLCLSALVQAQAYPNKTLRLVIPFPAGGATDIIGRVLAQKLGERLGQTVVVDNKPGAGGSIGSDLVAKAPADGYTLLLATSSTHSIGPILAKNLPYAVDRDFTPIGGVAEATNVLVVGSTQPVKTVPDLLAMMRANPGTTFASSGNGTIVHLQGELFAYMAGAVMTHIPYKGTALAMPDVISGQVTMVFDSIVSALPHIKAGRVRALAVTASKPSPLLPDVPTVDGSGLKGYVADTYFGLFAPAQTPKEIVTRLQAEMASVVQSAEVREKFAQQGVEPLGTSGDQLASLMRADTDKWRRVIEQAKVKLE
jgi:tripartite-type tricarboxylate transporter receptor subunit TctC